MIGYYPWQIKEWEALKYARNSNHLPHALLFYGPCDNGIEHFAQYFIKTLLCENPTSQGPCNSCYSCRLNHAGTHPDFISLKPQEPKKKIPIEMIREFIHCINTIPYISRYRVTLINPVESMSYIAMNNLLKILEEPPLNNYIILLSNQLYKLPLTIRSRCQKILFPLAEKELAIKWLKSRAPKEPWDEILIAVNNAPLRAIEFLRNNGIQRKYLQLSAYIKLLLGSKLPIPVASIWQQENPDILFEWLFYWTLDLCKANRKTDINQIKEPLLIKDLGHLIPFLNPARLFVLLDKILQLRNDIIQKNLNLQMQLESLAISFSELKNLKDELSCHIN